MPTELGASVPDLNGAQQLAAIALARGDVGLAEDLARMCLDGAQSNDPSCAALHELLVDVQLARGGIAAAERTAAALAELNEASGNDGVHAYVALVEGHVLAARGTERASACLQIALERFSALDLPLEAARARLALARTLATAAPDAAEAEARLALAAFERLGAVRHADGAASLLRELGATARAWPRNHGTLTKRETEVLSLLANGCSNAQIADRLVISRRTAEHHVASILSKLGLRSRAEVAAPHGPRVARGKTRSGIGSPTDAHSPPRGDSWAGSSSDDPRIDQRSETDEQRRGQQGGGARLTGNDIEVSGVTFGGCNDGRIEEEWELIDVPGLLGQIGAPPETAAG